MPSLYEVFEAEFGRDNARGVTSPLRICPLGAHIDHQHGLVTGMALSASVNMIYSPNSAGDMRVKSIDFPGMECFHVERVREMTPGCWGNYLRGTVLSLGRNFKLKMGINAVIRGRHPIGGLSSSAAVTTAYLLALCDVNGIALEKQDLIHYNHWVEKHFIGLNNGILDQSVNILSKEGHLMAMDCGTETFKLIPRSPKMPPFDIVVVYSGISTALMETDYNNRVDECRAAAWMLQELGSGKIPPFRDAVLRSIGENEYARFKERLPGRFRRRAEHFFTENERVEKGIEKWEAGDLEGFGRLVFESGESSIRHYECGCPELITIFEILQKTPGVYGARFSGAGYRGCCIGLVDPERRDAVKESMDRVYPEKHPAYGESYKVYFCRTGDGAAIRCAGEAGGDGELP